MAMAPLARCIIIRYRKILHTAYKQIHLKPPGQFILCCYPNCRHGRRLTRPLNLNLNLRLDQDLVAPMDALAYLH